MNPGTERGACPSLVFPAHTTQPFRKGRWALETQRLPGVKEGEIPRACFWVSSGSRGNATQRAPPMTSMFVNGGERPGVPVLCASSFLGGSMHSYLILVWFACVGLQMFSCPKWWEILLRLKFWKPPVALLPGGPEKRKESISPLLSWSKFTWSSRPGRCCCKPQDSKEAVLTVYHLQEKRISAYCLERWHI